MVRKTTFFNLIKKQVDDILIEENLLLKTKHAKKLHY